MEHDTRKEILQSALELFSSKGYDGTALSEIAARAGVTKSLVYHYFKKKDELLQEIIAHFFEYLTEKRLESREKITKEDPEFHNKQREFLLEKFGQMEPYLKIIFAEIPKREDVRESFVTYLSKWARESTKEFCQKKVIAPEQFMFRFVFFHLAPMMLYTSMKEIWQDVLDMSDRKIKEQFRDEFYVLVKAAKERKDGK
ncbi:MAG TPA: helix-turn-helix domain-containing protein [Candidatus Mcinerneyibacteriales bacterium]|nr:helix-turn-helix domain-containing protein [Candidatus Mcinerneyibacteriales bacterium]